MTTPGRLRILIVEDEMIIAMMLEDMLGDIGYEVVAMAAHPGQALTAIDKRSIDAAILDVNLGGQTSYPVADALARRGIPFLFSTGYGSATLAEPYRHHRLLQKPFREAELAASLKAVIGEGPGGR